MADVSHTTRLTTRMTGDAKHSAAATFTLDVLRVLYEKVLDVSPESVPDADRDRRYLSKGHGPMAYHAVLAERGSSRSRGWPAGARTTHRSGTTRTATWCPASRSPPARSATDCRSPSVRRWACGRRASAPGRSTSYGAAPARRWSRWSGAGRRGGGHRRAGRDGALLEHGAAVRRARSALGRWAARTWCSSSPGSPVPPPASWQTPCRTCRTRSFEVFLQPSRVRPG
jgi:hypothetical protein